MIEPEDKNYKGPRITKPSEQIDSEMSNDIHDAYRNQGAPPIDPTDESKDRRINANRVAGPLVVLVGPGNCGKTVALIRLLQYLDKSRAASWTSRNDFMSDSLYKDAVAKFETQAKDATYNPARTGDINYLLLEIKKRGRFVCQILEAPGEHYFSTLKEKADRTDLEHYHLQVLGNSDFRKIYIFFFEQGLMDDEMEAKYGNRLCQFVNMVRPGKDRIILLYNKVDERTDVNNGPKVIRKTLLDELIRNHSALMAEIENLGDNLLFLPFSGGNFLESKEFDKKKDGTQNLRWIQSNDTYPEELWRCIEMAIENNDRPWFRFR